MLAVEPEVEDRPHQWGDDRRTEPPELLEWKAPPASKKVSPWQEALAPLTEHPHRWGYFGWRGRHTVKSINDGKYSGLSKGEFEATTRGGGRKDDGDDGMLYVRYIGADPCQCGCLAEQNESDTP